jgi:hypothetical protein
LVYFLFGIRLYSTLGLTHALALGQTLAKYLAPQEREHAISIYGCDSLTADTRIFGRNTALGKIVDRTRERWL